MVVQVLNVAVLRTAWPHLAAMLGGLIGASVSFLRLIQNLISGGSRAAFYEGESVKPSSVDAGGD